MRKATLAAVACLLMWPAGSSAHRLDEYLQAARVSLARDRIALELDLTPGANVAVPVIALVDRDRDGAIAPDEAAAYARRVLSDLVLEVDGRSIALTLARVEVPPAGEMREGMGTIQIRADGHVETATARHREVYFRNNHQPDASVYLVNALVPEDGAVAVVAQTRDIRQREARIEYRVASSWPMQLLWVVVAAGGLSAWTIVRTAHWRSGGQPHREGAAHPFSVALHFHRAAVASNDMPHDREP
jgi:hypothetical protein